jgi:hypothetical protein
VLIVYVVIYFYFFFVLLGLGTNFTHNSIGLFYPSQSGNSDFHTVSNCTFSNITSTGSYPPVFLISVTGCPVTILNNTFLGLTVSYSSPNYASVGYLRMNSGLDYIFEGNTIYNITGSDSAIEFDGNFNSFSFTNNSFRYISSSSNAGVFFFFCFILL